MVSIYLKATRRATMNTIGEFFNLPVPTFTAILACERRVNFNHLPTSIFSFVSKILSELTPRHIVNTSVKRPEIILFHSVNGQIFNTDSPKAVNELSGNLMTKVVSSITNPFVDTSNNLLSLLSFRRTFSLPGQLTLCFSQRLLLCLEKARIFYLLTTGKSSKTGNTNINTYGFFRLFKRFGHNLTRKASIPFAVLSSDGEIFNCPFNWPVKFDFDRAYLRKAKGIVFNLKSALRISERIIPALSAKAGIARLFTRLNPAEKGLKGKVKSDSHILENLGIDHFERGSLLLQLLQTITLIKTRYTFLLLLPSILSLFKQMIVEPSAFIKCLVKQSYLPLSGSNSIFIGSLYHVLYYITKLLKCQVLLKKKTS